MKLLTSAHVDAGAAVTHGVLATARALFAPGAVVHLGAGTGQGPLHDWRQWPVPASLVLDAQPQRMAWAAEWAAQGSERFVSDALLAGADGQAAPWHPASNPDESGLVPPKALQKLWPQLKPLEPVDTPARSLDALLAEPAHAALLQAPNLWLVVDFFCGPDFWQGASATLAQARVLVLRQAKTAPKGIEPQQHATDRMAALGYVLAATLQSKHPEVVHGVYLRTLDHDLAAAQQQTQQLATKVQTLTAARDAEAAAKNEALAQRGVLAKEKNVLVLARDAEAAAKVQALAQRDALAQEKNALTAARDAEAHAKVEALKQRDALAQQKTAVSAARDAEAVAKAEAQKKRDELSQENAALLVACNAQSQAKAEALQRHDAEEKAKVAALGQCEALAQELKSLAIAHDAQETAAVDALRQRDKEASAKEDALAQITELLQKNKILTAACETETGAKLSAIARCAVLAEEKSKTAVALDTVSAANAKLQINLEGAIKSLAEQQVTQEMLRLEQQTTDHRQQFIQDEMLRAESQIELIKDLLLRVRT